jgi:hypothetical protein
MALNYQEVCMIPAVVSTLFLLLCFATASSQNLQTSDKLSDEKWRELETALEKEDWVKSADLAAKFLKEAPNGEEREVGLLRYIFIFASAGKVITGKMNYEGLEKAMKALVGKTVSLPPLVLTTNCMPPANKICAKKGESDELFSAATNRAGTNIHAFNFIQLEKKMDLTEREGRAAVVGGSIKAIAPNPIKSRLWVMRLYIENGFIEFPEKPSSRVATR